MNIELDIDNFDALWHDWFAKVVMNKNLNWKKIGLFDIMSIPRGL
jgi:hypothetical protein